MPGTFSKLYIQIVFAINGRENLIGMPPLQGFPFVDWLSIIITPFQGYENEGRLDIEFLEINFLEDYDKNRFKN